MSTNVNLCILFLIVFFSCNEEKEVLKDYSDSDNRILSFVFSKDNNENFKENINCEVDNVNDLVRIRLPFVKDLRLTPSIVLTKDSKIDYESGKIDFSKKTNFKVTSKQGNERIYTVDFSSDSDNRILDFNIKVKDEILSCYINHVNNTIKLKEKVPFGFASHFSKVYLEIGDGSSLMDSTIVKHSIDMLKEQLIKVKSKNGEERTYKYLAGEKTILDLPDNHNGEYITARFITPVDDPAALRLFFLYDEQGRPKAKFDRFTEYDSFENLFEKPVITRGEIEVFRYNTSNKISTTRLYNKHGPNGENYMYKNGKVFLVKSDGEEVDVTDDANYYQEWLHGYYDNGYLKSVGETIFYYDDLNRVEKIDNDVYGEVAYSYEKPGVIKSHVKSLGIGIRLHTYGSFLNCNASGNSKGTCFKPRAGKSNSPIYKLFVDFGYWSRNLTNDIFLDFIETSGELIDYPESEDYVNQVNEQGYPTKSRDYRYEYKYLYKQ